MNKATIRLKILKQRRLLAADFIQLQSQKVIKHITTSILFQEAQSIALYLPINGEVDLTALLNIADKSFYIPSIKKQRMQFHRHHNELNMNVHQYGLTQPEFKTAHTAPHLDLCLMPLVAFDPHGNRLGMGGGFYDRYFAANKQTVMAGVAYQLQQVEPLPTDSWDVKLQHIFTEKGHYEP